VQQKTEKFFIREEKKFYRIGYWNVMFAKNLVDCDKRVEGAILHLILKKLSEFQGNERN